MLPRTSDNNRTKPRPIVSPETASNHSISFMRDCADELWSTQPRSSYNNPVTAGATAPAMTDVDVLLRQERHDTETNRCNGSPRSAFADRSVSDTRGMRFIAVYMMNKRETRKLLVGVATPVTGTSA
jgi:hypothetical protein